jgi:hypothetical protein
VPFGGVPVGLMIKGGSFEEPPFHFLGTFFQSSKNRSMPISVNESLTHWSMASIKKEVTGEKLLPPLNRFFVEGLIRY